MKTTITRKAVEPFVTVDELKSYLQLHVISKNDELTAIIETATCDVENRHNVALRSMTLQLVGESDEHAVRLYYPCVDSVVGVKDLEGNEVKHIYIAPLSALKLTQDNTVVVDYRVIACDNAITYKAKVLATSALIFNGEY